MQKVLSCLTWRTFALAGLLVLAAAAGTFMRTPDTSSATTATTYVNIAGADVSGAPATFISVFLPSSMIITEGDSIQWKTSSGEPHTVLFLNNQPPPKEITLDTLEDPIGGHNPTYDGTKQIYSGFITPDPSSFYTVKFTKAGNFPFICLIHPGMDGTVTVLSPGLFVPTQAQVDASAKAVQAASEAAARRMVAGAPTAANRSANAGGTSTWTVPPSPYAKVPNGFVSQNAFTPARISIGAGDTVTWVNDTPAVHTVTLLGGGPPAGDPTRPTPNKTYTGGFATSGIIGKTSGIGSDLITGGDRYSLTFPNPGTYPYVCILHIDQGMAGVIEVGPGGSGGAAPAGPVVPIGEGVAGVTLRPPATGNGGLLDSAAAWPFALIFALAGITMLGVIRVRACA